MNGINTQVNTQEATLALQLIEQQKMQASNVASMPIWLNVIFTVLVTWLVYFELINPELIVSAVVELILLLAMFSILVLRSKYLQKRDSGWQATYLAVLI
jgi:uncharacterized membrane-anchored protein